MEKRDHSIPGSYGHYVQDALTFASWGMDYVKMDWCWTEIDGKQLDPKVVYPQMSKALNSTGRPIFFNFCEWGIADPWTWAYTWANSWRIGGDHHDDWVTTSEVIENLSGKAYYAGVGGWNDPDFLMTGGAGCKDDFTKICPGMSLTEYYTEYSIWAITSSPLIVSTEIRNMTADKIAILMNKEVIAVNQDSLAIAGDRIGFSICPEPRVCQIWGKRLHDGSYAAVLYNAGVSSYNVTFNFNTIHWINQTVKVRDLWMKKDLGFATGSVTYNIPSHGSKMIKITKVN